MRTGREKPQAAGSTRSRAERSPRTCAEPSEGTRAVNIPARVPRLQARQSLRASGHSAVPDDYRFGFGRRQRYVMSRRLTFALTVIGTIALPIAANTLIYAIVRGVLLD